MKNSKMKITMSILSIGIVVVGWYCWMSFNAFKDHLMENKMKTAISSAVNAIQYNVERTQMPQSSNNSSYYFARLDKHEDLVEKEVMYHLNNDSSVLPYKFVEFSVNWSGSTSYDIHVATVYPGALGIGRKLDLNYSQKLIAFKYESGSESFSSK